MLLGRFGELLMQKKILIFGASGSLGKSIVEEYELLQNNFEILPISSKKNSSKFKKVNSKNDLIKLKIDKKSIESIVWSQGINVNDSILDINLNVFQKVFDANVIYILKTLSWIISEDLLARNAKICIVSSIWQEISRQNKLSYTISKSALKGLILSLANDLSEKGVRVNAVLPGAINNNMTNQNLTKKQISVLKNNNGHKKLLSPISLAKAVIWLCSDDSDGITGEFIRVDYGYSKTRRI